MKRWSDYAKDIIIICALCVSIGFNVWTAARSDDNSGDISRIIEQQSEANEAIRGVLEQLNGLEGDIEGFEQTIRESLGELDGLAESLRRNNQESGDGSIESGILADRNIRLIRELQDRFGEEGQND